HPILFDAKDAIFVCKTPNINNPPRSKYSHAIWTAYNQLQLNISSHGSAWGKREHAAVSCSSGNWRDPACKAKPTFRENTTTLTGVTSRRRMRSKQPSLVFRISRYGVDASAAPPVPALVMPQAPM